MDESDLLVAILLTIAPNVSFDGLSVPLCCIFLPRRGTLDDLMPVEEASSFSVLLSSICLGRAEFGACRAIGVNLVV